MICPIMSVQDRVECYEEYCAWWERYDGRCCVLDQTIQLSNLKDAIHRVAIVIEEAG